MVAVAVFLDEVVSKEGRVSGSNTYSSGTDGLAAFAEHEHQPVIESELDWDDVSQLADRALADLAAVTAEPGEYTPTALVPFTAEEVVEETPVITPPKTSERILKSEILGVSDEGWTAFAKAMRTAQPGAVSASNALGMFELKPRRLADLGLMRSISSTRSATGRMVWIGEFVAPLSQKKFLADPKLQYRAFAKSMSEYVRGLRNGTIPRPDGGHPEGMTLSGVLAVLHRCGPKGLKNWNEADKRFPDTVALFERANGAF